MKTPIKNETTTQRFAGFVALLLTGLFLAGCVVTSVYPFYTQKDLVFEPALLGDWIGSDQDESDSGDFTHVEQLGDKGYRVVSFTEDRTNSAIYHLFRLKNQLFLDICPTNHSLDLIPVHQVAKVTQIHPMLESAGLNYKWLEAWLKKNPKTIRHVIVHDQAGGKEGERIVLTADTVELQKFILKYLNNTNAWQEPSRAKLSGVRRKMGLIQNAIQPRRG